VTRNAGGWELGAPPPPPCGVRTQRLPLAFLAVALQRNGHRRQFLPRGVFRVPHDPRVILEIAAQMLGESGRCHAG